jgi:hypothetical protein
MRYVIVQSCPVPALLAPFLTQCLRESGATLESCYRGPDAEALLHRYGKSSQRELYAGWVARRPGFNPANPPGCSTHELRSDGVAYPRWHRGARIPWWACGIDVDDAHVNAFVQAAARHGWSVWRPYPTGSEFHHVNFRKPPLKHRVLARLRASGGGAPKTL